MAQSGKRHDRLVFGVLLDQMYTGYQEGILAGTIKFCRENAVDLRCFITGRLTSQTGWEKGSNLLFDLADESNVDGLIIFTTALQNIVGRSAFNSFLTRYHPLPLVSIGEEVPDYPSLIADNEKGLQDLLAHLADVHGYKRLAFISGPRMNSEARSRFNVYKSFLAARGLPFDPDLVVEGDFTGISGRRAVNVLLDERRVGFDVIVAANDLSALGAIEELSYRDIRVPGQAFVVGFDDMVESKNASLTTVRQPLYEQGYRAAALLAALRRENPPLVIKLPTELVVRESCGCFSPNLAGCSTAAVPAARALPPDRLTEEIARRTEAAVGGAFTKGSRHPQPWLDGLLKALSESCDRDAPLVFIRAWNAVILDALADGVSLSPLQTLVSALREQAFAFLRNDPRWPFYEDQFHRARIMLEAAIRKEEAAQKMYVAIQTEKLAALGRRINAASAMGELYDILFEELPPLGIRSCYLALFEPSHEAARLAFAVDAGKRLSLPPEGLRFPSRELLPASCTPPEKRRTLSIHSLDHRGKNIGFLLLDTGDNLQIATLLESVREKISVALQSMIYIQEIVSQARHLELFNRRLEQSNSALQEFAYVVSHDLQEPLRKISAFGERLAQRARAALDEQGLDYLARMQNAAVRMQKLIESLLSYSRVTTMGKPFVPVDLSQILRGVLSDLEVRIEKSGARVEVAPLPSIEADPTQLRQLFQNLVGNALKFQQPGARPVVKIYALEAAPGERPALAVEDNGIGVDAKFHDKIFGVFQRLHGREEYEGSGIGLAICKKIMERHGGTISVKSAPGAGTTFILRFGPEKAPA